MLNFIDALLNRITMYKLVLYFLIILLFAAAAFGAAGVLPYSPADIGFSTLILLAASLALNWIFARVWSTHANSESVYITALILALIIPPAGPFGADAGAKIIFLIWAAALAMASKYLLAINRKHIFNPAALAVAITAFAIGQSATWWIGGNMPMLPLVFIGGLLVVRKIQRFDLVISFFVVALATIAFTGTISGPLTTIEKALLHTPIFFFAFIMLTEPLTTPPTRERRIAYGALTGILFAPAMHIGSVYSTPELALLAGNIFSWIISPKAKYLFTLKERRVTGTDTYDFILKPDKKVRFQPGQYMEWTLGGAVKNDFRGNRRYFTLASSPMEDAVHLGIKFYDPSSSFKKNMLGMQPGDIIMGGQLAGDFTLPRDPQRKLLFIAGGIGITPFRSMVKYIEDSGEKRDAILIYSNSAKNKIAYREFFDEASQKLGMRTVYAVTENNVGGEGGQAGSGGNRIFAYGRIGPEIIKEFAPDYAERMIYISGTHAMVSDFKKSLHKLGISRHNIKTDFFPGFA